ncbi:GGDEF domain-containing protein [uncultured Aquitalea sp.]|uniref:GGDEF domain-containing protein n=1 Tax=uncultured Aquitalea sp. TaxID=540272 RepID=UPI0025E4D0D9|nr:GGDEF domain-containing protein [uncultured Aquitalea sp.]
MNKDEAEVDKALAVDLFHRSRVSAMVALLGVMVTALPHWQAQSRLVGIWAAGMGSLLCWRMLHASWALVAGDEGRLRFVRGEAILCALTGLGWGAMLYLFDSGGMDALYHLRLMILATAIAFIMSTLSSNLLVLTAYVAPIVLMLAVFVLTHDYVQPKGVLLLSLLVFVGMIGVVGRSANLRSRAAASSNLAVLRLSEELNERLEKERELRESLMRLARTDELTGLLNRRAVMGELELQIARAQRYGGALAVLMMDLDHFKAINDEHGHAAGDLALKEVSAALREVSRRTDLLGRVGGEEFLVVLPAMAPEAALVAAERLRNAVAGLQVTWEGKPLQLSLSIGIAFHRAEDVADNLLRRADDVLYQAKHLGRNQIRVAV